MTFSGGQHLYRGDPGFAPGQQIGRTTRRPLTPVAPRPPHRPHPLLWCRAPSSARARPDQLEALRGDRAGQNSIRINDQFRLCFLWSDAGPEAVEIVDDH
jgi:hypothetical protein